MKLYELESGTKFTFDMEVQAPPDIGSYTPGTVLKLHNIDGMYSYCTDENGRVYYPVAWAEVSVV